MLCIAFADRDAEVYGIVCGNTSFEPAADPAPADTTGGETVSAEDASAEGEEGRRAAGWFCNTAAMAESLELELIFI